MIELLFPSEYSLGELVIYKNWRGNARIVPKAHGTVQIADDDRVILQVNQETCHKMERLRRIEPNILHGVGIMELDTQGCDLSELSRISGLEFVGLTNVHISLLQIKHLADLSELQFLHLDGTKPIPSLDFMSKMHRLEILGLGYTNIGDKELHTLPPLQLDTLKLSGTEVTDRSVTKLATLQSLSWLDIESTHISQEGRARLAALLPNCRIRDENTPLSSL